MASITLENAVREAGISAIVDTLDDGTGAGYVEIRSAGGTTLLATIPLNEPAFGTRTNGVATLDVTPEPEGTGEAAAGAGTVAAVCRFFNGDDTLRMSGTVSAPGGNGTIEIENVTTGSNHTTIAENDTIKIVSGTLTLPAS